MKILCYSSCYGNIFKKMIFSSENIQFDIILWYNLHSEIDYSQYLNYDIIMCEYVPSKFSFRSSDIFLNKIKEYNPNAKYIIYPLIVMYIFPFHNHHFGFMPNNAIDSLIKEDKTNNEIINLYEQNLIKFNPKDNYIISLNKLKEIEKICDIEISDYIEQNIQKEILFIDTLFPSNKLFNIITNRILEKIDNSNLQIMDYNFKTDPSYLFHINNSYYTEEMIEDLELSFIEKATANSHIFYYNKLKEYLLSKNTCEL
jgi:hypothetical protein